MPGVSMDDMVETGKKLYLQGVTNPLVLASKIAKYAGPNGAAYAGIAASKAITAGQKIKAATGNNPLVPDVLEVPADAIHTVNDLAGAVVEVASLPLRVLQWLTEPGTVHRLSMGVVGFFLITGGIMVYILTSDTSKSLVGTAADAVPVVGGTAKKILKTAKVAS